MRNSDMKSFSLLVVLVINVLSVFQHGQKMVVAEECEVEIRGFQIECMYYMNKGDPRILNPNDRCCKVITDAYPKLSCWCNSLSRKVGMLSLPHYIFLLFLSQFFILSYWGFWCGITIWLHTTSNQGFHY